MTRHEKRMHRYVAYRPYEHVTLGGFVRHYPRGARLEERNGLILAPDGEPICTTHSQNGRHFFAWDFDGRGLERGDICWALTEMPRKNRIGFRFNGAERDYWTERWGKYLQGGETILFNDELFRAPMQDLYALADYFNLDARNTVMASIG